MPLIDYKYIQCANIPLKKGYEIGTIATGITDEELKNKNKQYNIKKEKDERKTNRIQSRYSPLEFEDE